MVNIVIYLKKDHAAKDLVKYLLSQKLIASASIDENNISYEMENDQFSEKVYSVITAQSKALLFQDVVNAITDKIGEETPVNSTPIVASNKVFDNLVLSKTIQI